MERDDGVVEVILAGQEGRQFGLADILGQSGGVPVEVGLDGRVAFLPPEFGQDGQVLVPLGQSLDPFDLLLQPAEPADDLLRVLLVGPEVRRRNLRL